MKDTETITAEGRIKCPGYLIAWALRLGALRQEKPCQHSKAGPFQPTADISFHLNKDIGLQSFKTDLTHYLFYIFRSYDKYFEFPVWTTG